MAAVPTPPAAPIVAAFVANATATGLWSNARIAARAPQGPRTYGGPTGVMVSQPWAGPASAVAGPPWPANCNDRIHHAHPANNNNLCSSNANNNPLLAPPPNWPGLATNFYKRRMCLTGLPVPGAPPPIHPLLFSVCRLCHIHTESQDWYQSIEDDVRSRPPALPAYRIAPFVGSVQPLESLPVPNAPAYQTFLTHLCPDCEFQEQIIYKRRMDDGLRDFEVQLPSYTRMRRPAETLGFLVNTCTCLHLLEDPHTGTYCIRCRYQKANDEHDELLIIRQQNDAWLREIDIDGTGRLIQAGAVTKRKRQRNFVHRACRCGRDVTYRRQTPPEVMMCLGCEGIVHVGAYALAAGGGPFPPTPFAPPGGGTPQVIPKARRYQRAVDNALNGDLLYPLRRPFEA